MTQPNHPQYRDLYETPTTEEYIDILSAERLRLQTLIGQYRMGKRPMSDRDIANLEKEMLEVDKELVRVDTRCHICGDPDGEIVLARDRRCRRCHTDHGLD